MQVLLYINSAKFDENDPNIPDLSHFQSLHGKYFLLDELRRTEIICLKVLDYKLNYFTSYHFLVFYLAHGIIFTNEIKDEKNIDKIYSDSYEILENMVQDNKLITKSHEYLAASIISYIREEYKIKEKWNESMGKIYKLELSEFEDVLSTIKTYIYILNLVLFMSKKTKKLS